MKVDHFQAMHFIQNIQSAASDLLDTDIIKNQIAEALARRIEKAVKAKAKYECWKTGKCEGVEPKDDGTFRVMILVPNFPEGAVTDTSVAVRYTAA